MWRRRMTRRFPGHHKADNDFSTSWRGSETQIKLLYEFERRKELVVVL
jgi:hypothetical protein